MYWMNSTIGLSSLWEVSRATTVGTGALDSAIYFTGTNMTRHRVMNLTKQRDGATTYKKVMLRDAWVKHLDENTTELTFTTTVPMSRVNKVTCSNF